MEIWFSFCVFSFCGKKQENEKKNKSRKWPQTRSKSLACWHLLLIVYYRLPVVCGGWILNMAAAWRWSFLSQDGRRIPADYHHQGPHKEAGFMQAHCKIVSAKW